MFERFKRLWIAVAGGALVAQTLGCGTILYPERRGQKEGRIDAGVAILDGIGLLFFIIPGVIAFAVDFGNGCIYLPRGGKHARAGGIEELRFDPRGGGRTEVERLVREKTGVAFRLDQPGLQTFELGSLEEARLLLAGKSAA